MKQVFTSKNGIIIDEVPAPILKDESGLLVKTAYSLISPGTESSSIKSSSESLLKKAIKKPELVGTLLNNVKKGGFASSVNLVKDKIETKTPIGYSAAGIVVDIGKKVNGYKIGDKIACAGAGFASHAEYLYIPQNLAVKVPESVDLKEAAFVTLGAIGMHGIRRAKVEFGETVVVFGLGLIGQLVCQMLSAAGCKVIGVDISQERLAMAQASLSKALLFDSDQIVKEVLQSTKNIGADAVIVCAGTNNSDLINLCFKICRRKGRVSIVGAVGLNLERAELYKKEIDVFISCSYGPGRYNKRYEEKGLDFPIDYVRWTENRNMEEFISLIEREKINLAPLISNTYKIDQAQEAYEVVKNKSNIGILLDYGYKAGPIIENIKTKRKVIVGDRNKTGNINLALIGAGSFAKSVHLPNITKINDLNLAAVVASRGNIAKQIANQYKAAYCSTDYKEVLQDKEIDAVLISTRHNLHAQIICDAAAKGKHIFVEKPMCLTEAECSAIKEALEKNPIVLNVGFNRRFAPFALEAKDILNKSNKPKMITYRVNAGSLPLDHWLFDPVEGGGRILGEGCHFLDFFRWILDEEPVNFKSQNISNSGCDLTNSSNVASSISYSKGSVGVLMYSSVGNKNCGKERIEILFDDQSIIIDDFKAFEYYGKGKKITKKLKKIAKGHQECLQAFVSVLMKNKQDNVSCYQDGKNATLDALNILESLKKER